MEARPVVPVKSEKLMARVRQELRVRRYSYRTEQAYVHWIKRYLHFHGLKHPNDLAEQELQDFLTDLVVRLEVSASTQTVARLALRNIGRTKPAVFPVPVWAPPRV